MAPDDIALSRPTKPAAILPGGTAALLADQTLGLGSLVERSCRLARRMAAAGLRQGDHIAFLLENRLEYFELTWAAQRMGLQYVPVNWHLQRDEVAHILRDSEARWLFVSAALHHLTVDDDGEPLAPQLDRIVVLDDAGPLGYTALRDGARIAEAEVEEVEGQPMFYSSGTTGRPKGIKRLLPRAAFGESSPRERAMATHYGFDEHTVYLSPAPLYHAAPMGFSMMVQRRGGTVVVMPRFDAEHALQLIERHRVTHLQMVPTHFVQLLKLPEALRRAYDTSSLQIAIHAAAPCPVEVKQRMLDWWGPVIHEYYSFSEATGFTRVGPDEWLAKPGTVGKPLMGRVSIRDEAGAEVPTGTPGLIWFEGGGDFVYHNDPDKTAAAHDADGRTTVGDIGYVDADGYLFLTDRASHMIISGGVNIYPQEVENLLVMHPAVGDVGVIGVPDADYGERVVAVVVAAANTQADSQLQAELIAFCRQRLAHFKCPREVIFAQSLPRLPTGKLLKRQIRQTYSQTASAPP